MLYVLRFHPAFPCIQDILLICCRVNEIFFEAGKIKISLRVDVVSVNCSTIFYHLKMRKFKQKVQCSEVIIG